MTHVQDESHDDVFGPAKHPGILGDKINPQRGERLRLLLSSNVTHHPAETETVTVFPPLHPQVPSETVIVPDQ